MKIFYLQYVMPFFIRGVKGTDKIYHYDQRICLKSKMLLRAMMYQIMPDGMCPLLPFYGGIIINTKYMNMHTTQAKRQIFAGTFHQYIGCLWNELLKNENLCGLISEKVMVAIGHDVEKKTWIDEFQDTFVLKVPKFYEKLNLDEETRKEILNLYRKNILKEK